MMNPLGIDTERPRFSWRILSDEREVVQTGYEIEVSSDGRELWRSGHADSAEQLWVAYEGPKLKSNQHCTWRVRVYTNKGWTEWSEQQRFSTGLLSESRWGGRWIGMESLQQGEEQGQHPRLAARYVRKEFRCAKPVRRATAFVAGLGLHELHVNGHIYNDDVLQPLPTDYRKTILYNTYDITTALQEQNCIGLVLGSGRYFAYRQNKPYKNTQFGLPKCRVNIIIEYADGTAEKIASDEQWRITANGPIRANNEYDGEEYDARLEMRGWDEAGFDDSTWQQAERTAIPTGVLRAQMSPGMKAVELKRVPTVHRSGKAFVLDFQQNLAGWVSFVPRQAEGDTIRLRYAERLNADGSLYVANLRDARSTDIYIPAKTTTDGKAWHPTFVTHGFRYVEVSGMDELRPQDFRAYMVSDEMENTGRLETSDTLLNKVLQNAWWGIKSNYKGVPVDCPQRNERQPWLGDRTVGSLGESFVFGCERLYTKWMRDICEAQRHDGNIPDVAPAYWNYYTDDVTWPACLPFTCDMLYRQYGNMQPIVDCYPSMKRWILHQLEENMRQHIITKDKYGDWCMPPEKLNLIHSEDPARKTDGQLIATAYMIRCLSLMEEFARMQQLDEDARSWAAERETMTSAFNRQFLTINMNSSRRPGHVFYPDSTYYGNNTATANLLPLAFGIAPDSLRGEIAKQVVRNIVIGNKGHVSSGVIGISWLLRTLTDNGFGDVAYHVATQHTYPSWGYMVEQGATTIWELWNGDKADPRMNSANHVMLLGDLLTWCYQYLAGIRTDTPGYRHIVLQPAFDLQACSHVNASHTTPYGEIVSRWKKTLQRLHWEVSVPCNTTADLHFPDGTVKKVGSGHYVFDADIPTSHPAIIKDEFLYEEAPFPQCHATTIVETRSGDLVCAYFGGTKERNPDVSIYVSVKRKGSDRWEAPILAADGVEGESRKACWNPVLFEMPGGELWLFFKIGDSVSDWTGWLTKSADGGHTWSRREPLPEGFLGPIKNKPLLLGNRLLCGSSTERHGWRFHVEILDLNTNKWKYVGPVEADTLAMTDDMEPTTTSLAHPIYQEGKGPKPIYSIQPSFLQLSDGRLMVLMRTHNGRLAQSFSSDGCETWSRVTLSNVPSNQSGTDAVTLSDGRHVLAYNNFETLPGEKKGPRTPLSLAVSEDDGQTWQHLLTLEDSPIGEYSYPAIIEGRDGTLHVTYTWRRRRPAYKEIKL